MLSWLRLTDDLQAGPRFARPCLRLRSEFTDWPPAGSRATGLCNGEGMGFGPRARRETSIWQKKTRGTLKLPPLTILAGGPHFVRPPCPRSICHV